MVDTLNYPDIYNISILQISKLLTKKYFPMSDEDVMNANNVNMGEMNNMQENSNNRNDDSTGNDNNNVDNGDDENDTNDKTNKKIPFCCTDCKDAEKSNNGRTCVCVVPRTQRRKNLEHGCRTCGCQGCTKEDRMSSKNWRKNTVNFNNIPQFFYITLF